MAGNTSALGFGNPSTSSIVNAFSSGGVSTSGIQAASATNAAKEVLSGALTANTLATVLTVTGGGEVPLLSVYTKDATARTVRLQVIADGVTVYDATSNSVSATNSGHFAAGQIVGSGYFANSQPIRFNSSLVVKVASSLTETDKVAIAYNLYKR